MRITAEVIETIARCLREDLRDDGDITSDSVIPSDALSEAHLVARENGVVAGGEVAAKVFTMVDSTVEVDQLVSDGTRVDPGTVLLKVRGRSRSVLTAERTALNLMARMSGVASATARLVDAVKGTGARITDTRKTMPGLRIFDKYAVTAGGGVNHRMGLYDAVMIKDNHIVAAGDIVKAVSSARMSVGADVEIVLEIDSLDQLPVAMGTDADRLLLDNMSIEELAEAVSVVGDRFDTEASGGVTIETVREIAATGVDLISVGAITHSARQMDLALDFV